MIRNAYELPQDLRKALNAELRPGERILYAGQPDWRGEWGKLAAIFIFGLGWSAISFLFFGMSLGGILGLVPFKSDGAPVGTVVMVALLIFSLPFVAIGCVCLAAPFLGIQKSRNTVHGITDTRLLDVYTGRYAGANSYPLTRVNFIKRRNKRNGTGNLQIGYGVEKDSDGDPRPLTVDWTGIPDVQRAEAIVREQANWVR